MHGIVYDGLAPLALDISETRPEAMLAQLVTAASNGAQDVEIELFRYDEWRIGVARSPFAHLGVTRRQVEILLSLGARVKSAEAVVADQSPCSPNQE